MRKENEDFKAYKIRRKREQIRDKAYLKGTLVWNSVSILQIPMKSSEGVVLLDSFDKPITVPTRTVIKGTFRNLNGISKRKQIGRAHV